MRYLIENAYWIFNELLGLSRLIENLKTRTCVNSIFNID